DVATTPSMDRSIPGRGMTKVNPLAIRSGTAACDSRMPMLPGLTKTAFATAKTMNSTMRAANGPASAITRRTRGESLRSSTVGGCVMFFLEVMGQGAGASGRWSPSRRSLAHQPGSGDGALRTQERVLQVGLERV